MPPLSVLVVDDEGGIRRVLTRALERLGLSVQTAMSGEEACDILAGSAVDVVLMDLRMPTMSGQTLYHMSATQWPHLAARVIVMSGDPDAQDHEDWLGLHDLPVLTSRLQAVLVLNAADTVREAARAESQRSGHLDAIYFAKGGFLGMNGNYSAGILEGVAHYRPELGSWLSEAAETEHVD